MKISKFALVLIAISVLPFVLGSTGGGCTAEPSSDDIQREQQETLLKEASAATGMPSIKNFRERRILKDILELRDQDGLVTYTYLENLTPGVVKGHTALGGKLTFLGETIGYGIPYATQYTNPMKIDSQGANYGYAILPQADPNGLFSPAAAEGTWVLMKDPGGKKLLPIYVEPRIVSSPFKFPVDE